MVQYLSGVQRKWLPFLPRTNFLSAPRKQTPPSAFASPQVHILHSCTIVHLCFCTFVFLHNLFRLCAFALLHFCSYKLFGTGTETTSCDNTIFHVPQLRRLRSGKRRKVQLSRQKLFFVLRSSNHHGVLCF